MIEITTLVADDTDGAILAETGRGCMMLFVPAVAKIANSPSDLVVIDQYTAVIVLVKQTEVNHEEVLIVTTDEMIEVETDLRLGSLITMVVENL